MKIIDFKIKGKVVRFYLGEKTEDWGWTNKNYKDYHGKTPDWLKPSDTFYGDDWNDKPYEHNAERVYDEFIKGHKDIAFDFDDVVLQPCDGERNSNWSKNDMVNRLVPCVIVVPGSYLRENKLDDWNITSFKDAIGIDGIKKFYFGGTLDE